MKHAHQQGFTLLEIMVVVVILGILAALVVPKLMSRPEQARLIKAKHDILTLQSGLDLYKLDNGFYPSTEQGLNALVKKPTLAPLPANWKTEGYLQEVPLDPWGAAYHYRNEEEKIKIYSWGPQGKESDSVIGNWNLNQNSPE